MVVTKYGPIAGNIVSRYNFSSCSSLTTQNAYLEAKLLLTNTIETLQKPYNDTAEITFPFMAAFTESHSLRPVDWLMFVEAECWEDIDPEFPSSTSLDAGVSFKLKVESSLRWIRLDFILSFGGLSLGRVVVHIFVLKWNCSESA